MGRRGEGSRRAGEEGRGEEGVGRGTESAHAALLEVLHHCPNTESI